MADGCGLWACVLGVRDLGVNGAGVFLVPSPRGRVMERGKPKAKGVGRGARGAGVFLVPSPRGRVRERGKPKGVGRKAKGAGSEARNKGRLLKCQ